MAEWIDALKRGLGTRPLALVSVLATEGSAPRGAGTRMVVAADGLLAGTIGGGRLEFQAVEQAQAILGEVPGSWRVQDWPLGPLLGQCCGGRVRLLIEHVDPARSGWLEDSHSLLFLTSRLEAGHVARAMVEKASATTVPARGDRPGVGAEFVEVLREEKRPLYLFGAGHVGQAVARRAEGLPFTLCWFDSRPELSDLAGVTSLDLADAGPCITAAPDDAAILIMTHDHALDYALALAAVQRPQAGFVGLIGSSTKRARFRARLEKDGADPDRLTCPVGLAAIKGKTPDVIAMSVLAQLLALAPADTVPC